MEYDPQNTVASHTTILNNLILFGVFFSCTNTVYVVLELL